MRPELARAFAVPLAGGHPRRSGRSLRHEHPARRAGVVPRRARAPGGDPAERLPGRLLPAAQARDRDVSRRVPPGQIVVGAGCDEILALCAGLTLGRGDTALVPRPTYQLYTVASRNAGADVRALDPVEGIGLDWNGLLREAPASARDLALLAQQPDGRGNRARARRRALPRLPRDRGRRPGLPGVRRRRHAAARRVASEPRRRPHVLEGLRARRRSRRLRVAQPALAGALDALRPPGSISSWSAAVARDRHARNAPRDAEAAACASWRSAPGWPRRSGTQASRSPPRPATSCSPTRPCPTRSSGWPSAGWSCARSRTSRCSPTASASPSHIPTPTTASSRRWPSLPAATPN